MKSTAAATATTAATLAADAPNAPGAPEPGTECVDDGLPVALGVESPEDSVAVLCVLFFFPVGEGVPLSVTLPLVYVGLLVLVEFLLPGLSELPEVISNKPE